MASGIYYRFFANLMNKIVDLEADDIRIAILDNNHSFSGSNNQWSDISANEIIGTGYTAGGELLTNKAVTQAVTTIWDADDVSWNNATFSAYHLVIYDDTLSGDDLIVSIDLGGEQTVTDGTFTIKWDSNGIITLSE